MQTQILHNILNIIKKFNALQEALMRNMFSFAMLQQNSLTKKKLKVFGILCIIYIQTVHLKWMFNNST